MSLVFTEGFDWNAYHNLAVDSQWVPTQYNYTNGFESVDGGRTGRYMRVWYGGYSVSAVMSEAQGPTITIGVAVYLTNIDGAVQGFGIYDDLGNELLRLYWDIGGYPAIYNEVTDTVVQISSVPVTTGKWYYYEWTTYLNETTGSTILDVDGVEIINVQNIDTTHFGDSVNWLYMRIWGFPYGLSWFGVDDLYIRNDTIRHGKGTKIYTLIPISIGDNTEFTPRPNPNNYENVNDAIALPNTQENSATSISQERDTFEVSDIASDAVYVYAVTPKVVAYKDVSDSSYLDGLIKYNGIEYHTDTITLYQTYNALRMAKKIFILNPETELVWTSEQINGLQVGYYNAGN